MLIYPGQMAHKAANCIPGMTIRGRKMTFFLNHKLPRRFIQLIKCKFVFVQYI